MKVEATLKAPARVQAGMPKSIVVSGTVVEVWIQSPTGDSSDSIITSIQCIDAQQAQYVAKMWNDLMRNI